MMKFGQQMVEELKNLDWSYYIIWPPAPPQKISSFFSPPQIWRPMKPSQGDCQKATALESIETFVELHPEVGPLRFQTFDPQSGAVSSACPRWSAVKLEVTEM